jgi:hypothetical protein
MGVARGKRGGDRELLFNGLRVLVFHEKVLEMGCSDGCPM